MLNGNEILEKLKYVIDVNVEAVSNWSDDDIKEMMDIYLKTKATAKETSNNSLYMIAEEKISQLQKAVDFKYKNKLANHS